MRKRKKRSNKKQQRMSPMRSVRKGSLPSGPVKIRTHVMAEWRPYNSRYEVSSDGRVRSVRQKKLMRQQTNHNGYRQVKLFCDDGSRRWLKTHSLVLGLFVGPRPSPRHHGAHFPDRDKRNNRVDNLRWALPEENEADKREHGTVRNGLGCRLKQDQVADIRSRAANGESFINISRSYGVHRSSVSRIVRGIRQWERKAS